MHFHQIISFIHSFIRSFLLRPFKSSTTQRRSRLQHEYCIGVSRRSALANVGKGLAQGPYIVARAGVEPTTLRLKAIDSNKSPPCPTPMYFIINSAITLPNIINDEINVVFRFILASMKPYLFAPVLLETRIVSPFDRPKPIIGVCILERLLYVARAETPSIEVFTIPDISLSDLHLSIVPEHSLVRTLDVSPLEMPFNMAASAQSRCLFLTDFSQNVGCVWRVKPEGAVAKLTDNVGRPFGISISRDSYVIVVSETPNCLRVFSQSGEKVLEMPLDCEAPRQAICIEPGKFALFHGYLDPANRVVELDSSGHVRRCYGYAIGVGYLQINWPVALIHDNGGRMLACDQENCRVHLVQKDFRLRRRLVQLDRFSDAKPRRLCIDDLNGTLYVGQTDSSIKVYRIAYPLNETSSDHEDLLVKRINCFGLVPF